MLQLRSRLRVTSQLLVEVMEVEVEVEVVVVMVVEVGVVRLVVTVAVVEVEETLRLLQKERRKIAARQRSEDY